jgi:hypothetical protein
MIFYNCEELETKLYKSRMINLYLTVALVISIMFNIAPAEAVGLYARDGTYLGEMNANPYDANSISNPYGKYGSPYSPTSIKNPYSKYGSPYSTESVNNPYVTPSTEPLPSAYE